MTETAEKHELQRLIDDLYVQYRHLTDGQVATYIPELAKASPHHFGICIVTEDGRTFEVGDCDRPFTMQSVTKPFTFGMALEEIGHEEVWRYVGVEPSGDAFNSISLQDETNRPFNPMINTGAITVSALLHARHGAFYSLEGLALLAGHLEQGGVFALWSDDAPDAEFLGLLREVFASAEAEVVTFPNPLLERESASTVYVAKK